MLGGLLPRLSLGELVKLTDYSGGVDVLVFLVLIGVLLSLGRQRATQASTKSGEKVMNRFRRKLDSGRIRS